MTPMRFREEIELVKGATPELDIDEYLAARQITGVFRLGAVQLSVSKSCWMSSWHTRPGRQPREQRAAQRWRA